MSDQVQVVDRLLTAADVAQRLRVTPKTVYKWAANGTLPSIRIAPRVVRFAQSVVEDLIARTSRGA